MHRPFGAPTRLGLARVLGLCCLGFVTAACVTDAALRPAPTAETLPSDPSAAVARSEGVQVVADGARWRSNPPDLENFCTPVYVKLENASGRPLRVRYEEMWLVDDAGMQMHALPPHAFEVERNTRPSAVARYHYPHHGFLVAPYQRPYYRGFAPWPSAFPRDTAYYDRYHARWQPDLPTPAMFERALPEGVLEDGGDVAGFVYFQELIEEDRPVELHIDLVDAETGEPFGAVRIPYLVE
jgi:hypothetical protein